MEIKGDLIVLALNDWNKIKQIIETELKECKVTIVIYG